MLKQSKNTDTNTNKSTTTSPPAPGEGHTAVGGHLAILKVSQPQTSVVNPQGCSPSKIRCRKTVVVTLLLSSPRGHQNQNLLT